MCPVGALAGKCLVPILLGSLPTLTVTMVIMRPGTAAVVEHLPRGKASGSSSLTGCASQPLRAGGRGGGRCGERQLTLITRCRELMLDCEACAPTRSCLPAPQKVGSCLGRKTESWGLSK